MNKVYDTFIRRNIKTSVILSRHISSVINPRNGRVANDSTTLSSLSRIKKVIRNTKGYEDLHSCLRTRCPICPSDADNVELGAGKRSNEKHIYINKATGDVVCPTCQYVCCFELIESFFSSKKPTVEQENIRETVLKSKPVIESALSIHKDSEIQHIKDLNDLQVDEICDNFRLKNILPNHLRLADVRVHVKENIVYFPMKNINGDIVGYKKIIYEDGEWLEESIPNNNSFGIIMTASKKAQKNKTAVVVLNFLDYLALLGEINNYTIVCLPHGNKSLPQECLPSLESFQKLILWFDHNGNGWDAAQNFSTKLGADRCSFVRPTDTNPTPYNALQRSLKLKEILSSAKPILHDFITTFHALRNDVLSDLQNMDKVRGIKWKRFPILNKLLKGHRRGELTVLTGPTGSGKTTLMAEYSLDLVLQGVSTLWGSFEIRNSRLATTLLTQMVGHSLETDLDNFNKYADEFESLPMYFMTFHGQQNIKVVMEAIEHAQYVHDINHVVIDNLQFMMGTSGDNRYMDRFWMQDEIIAALRAFATKRNCHVTLVIHPRKERENDELSTSSIFGGAKATQEADNVLIIQDKRLVDGKGKKHLQVAKNRFSGDLGNIPLDFNKDSLSYVQKLKERSKDIKVDETKKPK